MNKRSDKTSHNTCTRHESYYPKDSDHPSGNNSHNNNGKGSKRRNDRSKPRYYTESRNKNRSGASGIEGNWRSQTIDNRKDGDKWSMYCCPEWIFQISMTWMIGIYCYSLCRACYEPQLFVALSKLWAIHICAILYVYYATECIYQCLDRIELSEDEECEDDVDISELVQKISLLTMNSTSPKEEMASKIINDPDVDLSTISPQLSTFQMDLQNHYLNINNSVSLITFLTMFPYPYSSEFWTEVCRLSTS